MIFARASLRYTSLLQVPKGSSAVFLQKAVDWDQALSFIQDERTSEIALASEGPRMREREPVALPTDSVCTPPTDLLPATTKIETIKIKVSDGSTVNMKIFSIGSPEEYLSHIVAVLHLIDRKGLREQSSTFYGEMRNANAALKRKAKAASKEKDQSEADEEQSDEATEAEEVTEEADKFEKLSP